MPIYEYACRKCEHVFDVLQKMTDEPLTYCPECGAPELKKLLSAPSFRLKGGGWYETDFKTGGKRNLAGDGASKEQSDKGEKAAKGEKGEKGDKAGKADGGSDKPAAKPADSKGSAKTGDGGG